MKGLNKKRVLLFLVIGIILLFTIPELQVKYALRNCKLIQEDDSLNIIFNKARIFNGYWIINDTLCMGLGNANFRYNGRDAFEITVQGDRILKKLNSEELILIKSNGDSITFPEYFEP